MLLQTFLLGFLASCAIGHQVFQSNVENTVKETDTATVRVKVGKKKFSCKFEIVHRDSLILMDESSVDCTPNKPSRQKAFNIRLKGSHGYDFSASILINPDVLTDVFVESLTSNEMMQISTITNLTDEHLQFGCNTKPLEDSDKRGAAGANIRLWSRGVVPYSFTSSFTYTDRLTFAKAVEVIEAVTCLKFVGRSNQQEYIRIERECACGGTCFGGGYTDGLGARAPRRLVIGSACISPSSASGLGLVIHETLHALGVVHTQTRPDRDTHIWVDFDKITASGQSQYTKCSTCVTHGTPYDCMSVMHYRDWGFSLGGPTMLPRRSTCDLKTATNKLTKADIDLLNAMYSCTTDVAVNGQWGPWSAFSECNAKCGTGRKGRYRLCNNPKPKNGGGDCEGHKTEEENCMEQACKGCAQVGKNTKSRVNSQTFSNIKSWAECSTRCFLDTSCAAWTWNHENAGSYAFKCSIMTGYASLVDDSNTVSGSRSCSGCPEKNVNLQDRVGNEVITGVRSWVDCSRKCSAKSSCTAWVWAHEGAGDYAYRCGIMDAYGKKAIDSNVISGSRDCPGVEECTGLKGSSACCTEEAPCKEQGGDCDDDKECEGSLVCGTNNCRDFNPSAEETYDCCVRPIQKCNGEEGTGCCCTAENPCELGGGDCDKDSECSGDLVCGYNNCRDFHQNAGSTHDCCKQSKVDGGWSAWAAWSTCTKTRARQCTNPVPDNGGAACSGKNEEVVPCSSGVGVTSVFEKSRNVQHSSDPE